jgi:superoxide dismutase, Fe-Mn family
MPFTLPDLPYSQDALAPNISAETLSFHYGKHHRNYVNKLNELTANTPMANQSLEEVVKKAGPGPVFNNAGQVWNHNFYWRSLSPAGGGEPKGDLAKQIDKGFGNFAEFKKKFTQSAVTLFGSGWSWLVRKPDGSLAIVETSNAGTPITGSDVPLLTSDVWEHAYYVDRRNDRAAYLEAWWKLVNWEFATQNLAAR